MISAVILTKNSSATLDKTLSSLSFCDELIVVDDESTDETEDIAKKNHAILLKRVLDNDFAAQRNFGLSKAKGDWVLFVDSDEVVSQKLSDEIKVKISHTESEGFIFRRFDELWGKTLMHGEISTVRLLRLAKRNAGIWTRPVHEVWNVKGKTEELDEPLIHRPHQTVREFLSDVDKYSTINAQTFYKQNVRTGYFGVIAYPLGKFLQNYFFRLGFLDGMPGLILALMMSFHSFLTRGKLWELQQKDH